MRILVWALMLALAVSVAPATSVAGPAGWHGSKHAMPSKYSWLDDYTPDVDYAVIVVRGLSPAQVRHTLGTVKRQIRPLKPGRAEAWDFKHMDENTYFSPPLALVDRRGPAVFVYLPSWVLENKTIARLSRKGSASHFWTDIELDTYVTIAKRGKVVRSFDAGFRPPRKGALPEEKGLDWGSRHQNIWATAWAFLERVSRIHLARHWFNSKHPAYVFE